MAKINCTPYWKPASRSQIRLIKAWEETALRQHIAFGVAIIILVLLFLAFWVGNICEENPDMDPWKPYLVLLLDLFAVIVVWGANIYIHEKALWSKRIYTCGVICIGRTVVKHRIGQVCYLDICTESGETVEGVKVPTIVMNSIKHQERILAVTNNPAEQNPLRLYPLQFPDASLSEDQTWYVP